MDDLISEIQAMGIKELWVIKEIVILITTICVHFGFSFFFSKLTKASKHTNTIWDDVFVLAARKPINLAVWLIGISIALVVLGQHYNSPLLEYVAMFREAVIVICLAWFSWNLISEASVRFLEQDELKGEEVDHTTVDALSKLGHLVVMIAAVLTLMQTFGFSVSGLLAAGGIGGIAIGFAAKDLIANFFGGFTIYTDRPFVVGDWVRSPDKDIEGIVEKISWRYTQIRRFNKNLLYVPNAVFTTVALENPSRMTNRRIKETIGIRYEDIAEMAGIVEDVKAMLKNHDEIDSEAVLIVNFNAFNASSIDFFIYTMTKTIAWAEYHVVKQDVLLKIADIIAQHGAEIAFPTRTLHIEQGNPEQR